MNELVGKSVFCLQMLLQNSLSRKKKSYCNPFRISCRPSLIGWIKMPYSFQNLLQAIFNRMDKEALFLSEYPAGDLSRKKKIPLSFQMLLQAILSYSFQMLLQAISSRKRKWCHIPFRISCRPSFLVRKNIPYSFYIDALTGQPFLEEKRYHIPFRCSHAGHCF